MNGQALSTDAIKSLLKSWGMSQEFTQRFEDRPETVEYLRSQRSLDNFPANYTPSTIEIFYEDIIFFRYEIEAGEVTFCRPCPEDFDPLFSEWKFDGDCAFFQSKSDIVVNRIADMAELDRIVGWLDEKQPA